LIGITHLNSSALESFCHMTLQTAPETFGDLGQFVEYGYTPPVRRA